MSARLTATDRRVIIIAIVVAGVSLALGLKYFSHAFPEASIEFRVNRDDSAPLATKFLADRTLSTAGYRHAAVFDFDDDAKVYLERTQGLKRMDTLTRGPIHLWHWSHRWFKAEQKEEFRVDVTPSGQVVGFDHEVPESAPGASLDSSAARALAEIFLATVMQRDVAGLEFVDSVSEKRPARTDYTFTWKQKGVDLGDGSLRVAVEIDGDQVGGYREFVKIPDGWTRDYQKLRSRNETANMVDEVPWILLSIGGLVLLLQRLRRRDVPIRLALGFGLVTALLYLLGQLNMFSQAEFGYDTTKTYFSFVSGYLVENLLGALAFGSFIFLLMASSEPIYREAYPAFVSIRRYFSWQGLRSRSFFIANVVGVSMTFFFFAYQTVFYLAANRLGAWAPAEVPFTDLLNTRFPWVMVLFVGFFPAVSEEIQFRAFAIPFLRKYLKLGPLAVVIAAFVWGFLHSAYPNQPFFIRGLEVGFGGVIVGLIMLRFGIMATLIWHYSVDALYTAFLLLRSPNHYLMISGGVAAGIMLIPLVVSLIAYLQTGTFSEERPLVNAAEKPPEATPETVHAVEAPLDYQPLSSSRLVAAAALTVIFAAVAFIPVYRFGKGIVLNESPQDVVRIADDYLRSQKVDPAAYRHVEWINDNVDSSALHYIAQRKSLKDTDHIYRQATRLALWTVRYFQPLHKEEYQVSVDPVAGEVYSSRHILDEDAPGASLSSADAQQLAEQTVLKHGYQLQDFELQSSDAKKRKNREDYTLVWQAKNGDPRNVGDANYRLQVGIAGNQVTSFVRSFKLPEEWQRAQAASNIWNNMLIGVTVLTFLGVFGAGLIVFVNLVRAGRMQWRRSVKFGILLALLGLFATLNALPQAYRAYDTSKPMAVWKLQLAVTVVVVPLLQGLMAWLVIGCAVSLFPNSWKLFRGAARRVWKRDALVALALSLAAGAALTRIEALLTARFHAYAPIDTTLFSATLSNPWPAVAIFLTIVSRTLLYAAAAGLAIYIVRSGWNRRSGWLGVGLVLVLVFLGPANAHSLAEFGAVWLMNFVPLAVAALITGFFLRGNILAYLVVLFALQSAEALMSLFSQPNRYFLLNGAVLTLLVGIVLAWMLWPSGQAEGGAEHRAASYN